MIHLTPASVSLTACGRREFFFILTWQRGEQTKLLFNTYHLHQAKRIDRLTSSTPLLKVFKAAYARLIMRLVNTGLTLK